jgi:putative membrane protein
MINARKLYLIALASTGIALAMSAQDKPGQQTERGSGEDTKGSSSAFIKHAANGNNKEIALAELATTKSQNAEIKEFAEHIRKDHTEANTKLKPIAQKNGVTINETSDAKQQRVLAKFQNLSGAQFDQEYAKEMLRDHQKTIAKFEQTAKEARDSDVQQYAQETLPKLREHLQHAKTAAKAVGVDEETITSLAKGTPEGVGGTGDEENSQTGGEKNKNGAEK